VERRKLGRDKRRVRGGSGGWSPQKGKKPFVGKVDERSNDKGVTRKGNRELSCTEGGGKGGEIRKNPLT